MLRRSLTRYIQRDINNVVNRQTMVREPGDPKRYLSFGLRVNNRQEIVWSHTSYASGGEEEVYEILKKLVEEESNK